MSNVIFSRFRRPSKDRHPKLVPMFIEWSTHVGIWIVGLLAAYAIAGMIE